MNKINPSTLLRTRGFSVIAAVIIAVVALAAIGGGVWYYQKTRNTNNIKSAQESQITATTTESSSQNVTAGWKTYTSEKYGFEFKYPQDYKTIAPPKNIDTTPIIKHLWKSGGISPLFMLTSDQSTTPNVYSSLSIRIFNLNSYFFADPPGGIEYNYNIVTGKWDKISPPGATWLPPDLPIITVNNWTGYKAGSGDAGSQGGLIFIPNKDKNIMIEIEILSGPLTTKTFPIDEFLSTFKLIK